MLKKILGLSTFSLIITACGGGSDNPEPTVSPNPVNRSPVIVSDGAISVDENSSGIIYTGLATDSDSDGLSFSITGVDAALFSLNSSTGEISFLSSPDFETPIDEDSNNVYVLDLGVADGNGGTDSLSLSISVEDVFENSPPAFTSAASVNVDENYSGVVYTALATDSDSDSLSFIIAGTDSSLFSLDLNTGELSFLSAPDFENPTDEDTNNIYAINIEVSDGNGGTDSLSVSISIDDVFENTPPSFTSETSINVNENNYGIIYTATAEDIDNHDLVYSISGGVDAAQFSMNPENGVLSFVEQPNYEFPTDEDQDNTYSLEVSVTDSLQGSDTINLSVLVSDMPELDITFNEALNKCGAPIPHEYDVTIFNSDDSREVHRVSHDGNQTNFSHQLESFNEFSFLVQLVGSSFDIDLIHKVSPGVFRISTRGLSSVENCTCQTYNITLSVPEGSSGDKNRIVTPSKTFFPTSTSGDNWLFNNIEICLDELDSVFAFNPDISRFTHINMEEYSSGLTTNYNSDMDILSISTNFESSSNSLNLLKPNNDSPFNNYSFKSDPSTPLQIPYIYDLHNEDAYIILNNSRISDGPAQNYVTVSNNLVSLGNFQTIQHLSAALMPLNLENNRQSVSFNPYQLSGLNIEFNDNSVVFDIAELDRFHLVELWIGHTTGSGSYKGVSIFTPVDDGIIELQEILDFAGIENIDTLFAMLLEMPDNPDIHQAISDNLDKSRIQSTATLVHGASVTNPINP